MSSYKPVLGVSGKPILGLPFGLGGVAGQGNKPVIMASPDPYEHGGYVGERGAPSGGGIQVLANGISISDTGSGSAVFNMHYKPGKAVKITFQGAQSGSAAYAIGGIGRSAENTWEVNEGQMEITRAQDDSGNFVVIEPVYYRWRLFLYLLASAPAGQSVSAQLTFEEVDL